MNGLGFIGSEPVRCKRKYKIRVCDKCIDNIKKYCRENSCNETGSEKPKFVEEFNKNIVSKKLLNSCKKAGRLFRRK